MDDRAECLLWAGNKHRSGYGVLYIKHRQRYAHRVAYEAANGPIPDGFDVGHTCHDEAATRGECNGGWTCRHRLCVEPTHLIAMSRHDNLFASPLTIVSRLRRRG